MTIKTRHLKDEPWFIEKTLDYILHTSQVFLLILDPSGEIRYANTYARTLLNQDLTGVHVREILLSESWYDSLLSDWAASDTSPIMNIRTSDSLPRTLYITIYQTESGYLIFGHTDSEELHRLSKEVLGLNRELGLLTRELQVRNRELAELNTMKNQFLGMAAHDLRSPLSLILNYTDFLMEDLQDSLSDEHREFLEAIISSALDMKQVIADFLDVSIIESGHLIINPARVSWDTLMQELIRKTGLSAERREIRITWKAEGEMPTLHVDAGKIGQVLVNLVHNAIEYSPDQGEIEILGERTDQGIVIMVKDHGSGISKEKQEKLFSEFSGTSRKKKDGERSIGLGLVISRKIVEAHGGSMFVESIPEVGSTFGFILPVSAIWSENEDMQTRQSGSGKV